MLVTYDSGVDNSFNNKWNEGSNLFDGSPGKH